MLYSDRQSIHCTFRPQIQTHIEKSRFSALEESGASFRAIDPPSIMTVSDARG